MEKLKIVVSQMYYPITMGKYIEAAIRRRSDVELFTVGPYTGTWIPWNGGMEIDAKYCQPPDLPMPKELCYMWKVNRKINPAVVSRQLPWHPDVWIQIDAGFSFLRPDANKVIHIATDPHCIDYSFQRGECDYFFGMQGPYLQPGDRYLPYAFDPFVHYQDPWVSKEKVYDVCFVGVPYDHRTTLIDQLLKHNIKTYYGVGKVYDEYRTLYNQSKVDLSQSSKDDLPARVWEGMGMGLPVVSNRIPDLNRFFKEDEHYLGFSTEGEALDKIQRLLQDEELRRSIGNAARELVYNGHTWDDRVKQVFEECELI